MLFQNKCLSLPATFFVCALLFVGGCRQSSLPSPPGYEIHKPIKTQLSTVLNEISGICYNPADSTLLAISDSKEKVFQLDIKHNKLKDYTGDVVAPDSDLEDITRVGSSLFLLMSRGVIVEIPDHVKDTIGIKTYSINSEGQNDYESLYYDATINGLVMLCKSCTGEKSEGVRTAFRFDLSTKTFDAQPFFTIERKAINTLLKNDAIKFTPSAAAVHPLNKRLYILSGTSSLLIVADTRGKVMEAYELNPDDYPQAEGIAFAPNGDMYITNEGKYGKPTLLRIPYHQEGKKK